MPRSLAARAGGRLTWAAFVLASMAVAVSLAKEGTGEHGLRAAVRATARIAIVVFAVAFSASSLNVIARAAWSRWLLLRRRDLGLGFADLLWGIFVVSYVGGAGGQLLSTSFLGLLALTLAVRIAARVARRSRPART